MGYDKIYATSNLILPTAKEGEDVETTQVKLYFYMKFLHMLSLCGYLFRTFIYYTRLIFYYFVFPRLVRLEYNYISKMMQNHPRLKKKPKHITLIPSELDLDSIPCKEDILSCLLKAMRNIWKDYGRFHFLNDFVMACKMMDISYISFFCKSRKIMTAYEDFLLMNTRHWRCVRSNTCHNGIKSHLFRLELTEYAKSSLYKWARLQMPESLITNKEGMLYIKLIYVKEGHKALSHVSKVVHNHYEPVTIEKITDLLSDFPDPELLICCDNSINLKDYPPWPIRLTEISCIPTYRPVTLEILISSLVKYSDCEQRVGC